MPAIDGLDRPNVFRLWTIPDMDAIHAHLERGEALGLDVRTRGEHAKRALAGVLLVPLDELRDALEEVPRDRPLVVFSKTGFEGHLAARILRGAGFEQVRYVSGGMRSVSLVRGSERHLQR